MKKCILGIILFLFVCGCSNKVEDINTLIENTDNTVIGINYPITNTKLDDIIKNDIDKIYNSFKEDNFSSDNKNELNVDYTYTNINGYISIGLFIYKNEDSSSSNDILTYNYDTNKNKILNIEDITYDLDIIEEFDINNLNFTFSNQYLTIYGVNNTNIPLSDLNLKINLKQEETIEKVNVDVPEKVIDPNGKIIALTFDDGPSNYTNELIEYLNSEGCNATFFILGNKVKTYQDTLIKSLKYGNELGNHSYNHKWLIKLDEESFKEQIVKTQDIIEQFTGYTPKVLRPTYGSINSSIKNNTDLDIVLWNVDTMDWKYKSVDTIVKRATKNLKDGNIILMHDTHKRTVEAVKKIVPIIKENGFICVTASEMKEINLIREQMNE